MVGDTTQNKVGSKPSVLRVQLDSIPAELCCLTQFGVWRFEEFADEETGEVWWDKVPINARTGWRASSTNPQTWSTFDVAARACQRGGYDGLAFFLKPGGGLVGIDLDKCRDATSGAIERWAKRIVDRMRTYTELSPSARGLRLFGYGELPPRDRREGRFECYERARFLTLTGHRLDGSPSTIEHRQVELTAIHTEIFAARVARRNAAPPPPRGGFQPHHLSDLDIIDKAAAAKNGAKFRRLYSGDISGYGSHSEADAALCSMLAFYTGPDAARIDELFCGSGLMRGKWGRPDYRDRTIALALSGRSEYYRPRRALRRDIGIPPSPSRWRYPNLPRKKQPEYVLKVFRNGTVRASLKAYEKESGELRYEDKEDLATATGRTKAAKRMAAKLNLRNVRHYEELLEQQWHEARDEEEKKAGESSEADGPPQATSASTRLVKIALSSGAELTHAPDGQGHLTVTREGRRETWPIRSRAVRSWLRLAHYTAEGRSAGSQAIEDALGVLEGMALCQGEEHAVHVRIAGQSERIYLDLADAERHVVEIDRNGWRIVARPPVRFRRTRGLLALPVPVRGGALANLRPILNLESDRDWFLLAAWALAALRPHGPYPVLCLHGEQGAAKSTTARALRSLIDPSAACLRSEPRDGRDVMIAATNGWIVALDNLSSIQPWLSDCLCRLATGGGYATRELYSDAEEVILDAQRPVILTSIEDLATRGDLLDRAIVRTLPAISEERRRPEKELWAEYEHARPRLLGALLDALAGALDRLPSVQLDRLPRMADFALMGIAAEQALGWTTGSFAAAYGDNREQAHCIALESSPVVPPLLALAAERDEWTGIASELLEELGRRAGEQATKRRDWPAKARGLTGTLRRLLPALRAVGVNVTFAPRRGRGVPITISGVRGVRGVRGSPSCSHETPFDDDEGAF